MLGPLVAGLRPREPSEDKLAQSGWQRARGATVGVFERPAGATGAALAVLIGALAQPLGSIVGAGVPQAVEGGLSALLAYWLAPTVYAGYRWVTAPARQRDEARTRIDEQQRAHDEAVATAHAALVASQDELADVRHRVKCLRAVEEMEQAVSFYIREPGDHGGHLGKWTEHESLFTSVPELRDAHGALARFYEDVGTYAQATRVAAAHRRHPRAAAMGSGRDPQVVRQEAEAREAEVLKVVRESATTASHALSKQRERLIREDPYA